LKILHAGNKKALEKIEQEHAANVINIYAKKWEKLNDIQAAILKDTEDYETDRRNQIRAADDWYYEHKNKLMDLEIEYTRTFKGELKAQELTIDKWAADYIKALKDIGEATEENIRKVKEMANKQKADLNPIVVGLKEVGDNFQHNFIDNITDAIMGAKSLKEAFSDLIASMASDLIKLGLKMIWLNTLKELFGEKTSGLGSVLGSIFSSYMAGANGGIFPGGFQSFATGGITKKPTLGLVGEGRYNEAIVPLPDGKSIPVTMKGGGGFNTTINVNVNSQSGTKEENEKMGSQVSDVINYKFKEMLSKEMRVGGMLNRSAY
jgi:hypothetical protein